MSGGFSPPAGRRRLIAGGASAPVVESVGLSPVDQEAPNWRQALQRELRVHRYALRTEAAYLDWLKRYVHYHGGPEHRQMGEREVKEYPAIERHVAPSTQNQAFSALLFAYTKVYEKDLGDLTGTARAKGDKRLPVALTTQEVQRLLAHLSGT